MQQRHTRPTTPQQVVSLLNHFYDNVWCHGLQLRLVDNELFFDHANDKENPDEDRLEYMRLPDAPALLDASNVAWMNAGSENDELPTDLLYPWEEGIFDELAATRGVEEFWK